MKCDRQASYSERAYAMCDYVVELYYNPCDHVIATEVWRIAALFPSIERRLGTDVPRLVGIDPDGRWRFTDMGIDNIHSINRCIPTLH